MNTTPRRNLPLRAGLALALLGCLLVAAPALSGRDAMAAPLESGAAVEAGLHLDDGTTTMAPVLARVQPLDIATRPVDVVVVLDTSGSMEDLLDATRARIWDVVNTLGRLLPTPELRVGLLTYGTERATADEGWIVLDADLTSDLDAVYGALMALTTEGGDEYVGQALYEAIDRMDWSRDPEALRIIFLAGNESADQNVERYDFRASARMATGDGIIINALYAGNRDQGIVEQWPEVARLGLGNFSAIDPEKSTIQIATPFDETLLELNSRLNGTYLPYGPDGARGLANQLAQDGNASRLGVESCSARIVAKGSALYTNASWDLVDGTQKGVVDVATLHPEDLPEEMREMNDDQRRAHIDRQRAAREAVQLEIQEISVEREQYVRAWLAKERMARGLDDAMRGSLLEQAKAKGFTCDDC